VSVRSTQRWTIQESTRISSALQFSGENTFSFDFSFVAHS
jgi:hypothetical protein